MRFIKYPNNGSRQKRSTKAILITAVGPGSFYQMPEVIKHGSLGFPISSSDPEFRTKQQHLILATTMYGKMVLRLEKCVDLKKFLEGLVENTKIDLRILPNSKSSISRIYMHKNMK